MFIFILLFCHPVYAGNHCYKNTKYVKTIILILRVSTGQSANLAAFGAPANWQVVRQPIWFYRHEKPSMARSLPNLEADKYVTPVPPNKSSHNTCNSKLPVHSVSFLLGRHLEMVRR